MRRIVSGCLLLSICVPWSVVGASSKAVTRRDGFVMLWESIQRPAAPAKEKPFADVLAGSPGFEIITYAKARGLLDDGDSFHPDDPLQLPDALMWLLRTRNVAAPDAVTVSTLPKWLQQYRFGDFVDPTQGVDGSVTTRTVDTAELKDIRRNFDDLLAKETHEVSLYAEKFHGKGTAFGESFDMHAMTAAHRTYPHNTLVKVTNIDNGKSVVVRINDRGPFVEGRDMDLSLEAFTSIAERSKGKIRATFERLGDASMITSVSGSSSSDTSSSAVSVVACSQSEDSQLQVRVAGNVRLLKGIPRTVPLGKDVMFDANRELAVQEIRSPDGEKTILKKWVRPGESFVFTPSTAGKYIFLLTTTSGRRRIINTSVIACS